MNWLNHVVFYGLRLFVMVFVLAIPGAIMLMIGHRSVAVVLAVAGGILIAIFSNLNMPWFRHLN